MKKLSLVLLALALAFAITPAALAAPVYETIGFTYTDLTGGVTATGTVAGDSISPGVFNVTTGSGTFNEGNGPVAITLLANPNSPGVGTSPSGAFNYDNLVTPGAPTGQILDTTGGLLFLEASGSNNPSGNTELNIWSLTGVAASGQDNWSEHGPAGYSPDPSGWGAPGTFTVTSVKVPEPSMALLLIPALGFVGVIRKKFMV